MTVMTKLIGGIVFRSFLSVIYGSMTLSYFTSCLSASLKVGESASAIVMMTHKTFHSLRSQQAINLKPSFLVLF
jgi:hypothetical protein